MDITLKFCPGNDGNYRSRNFNNFCELEKQFWYHDAKKKASFPDKERILDFLRSLRPFNVTAADGQLLSESNFDALRACGVDKAAVMLGWTESTWTANSYTPPWTWFAP